MFLQHFFVVGSWVDKYPESVKALSDARTTPTPIRQAVIKFLLKIYLQQVV